MKRILIFISVFFSALFAISAAENYYYEDYNINVELEENGVMHYREDILVRFTSPMHGIYRDIQYLFDEADPFYPIIADVSNIMVYGDTEAKLEKADGFYSIRFGSADKVVEGLQKYSFSYDFYLGPDRYSDFDEFYQNMLSSANDFYIRHMAFSVKLPKKTDLTDNLWITFGDYGSDKPLPYSVSDDGLTISGEAYDIKPYQAISVRIQFPEGYYVGQNAKRDYTVPAKIITAVLSVILLAYGYLTYKKYGVDEQIVSPVRFKAPDGMSPLDVEYLKNLSLNGQNDTVAMLFYWADKGYVEIIDKGGRKNDFTIRALKPLANASEEETRLYSLMFGNVFPSERTVKDLGKKNLPSEFAAKLPQYMKKKYSREKALFDSVSKSRRVSVLTLTIRFGVINAAVISIRYIGLLFIMSLILNVGAFLVLSLIADAFSKKDSKGKSGKGLIIAYALCSILFIFLSLNLDLVFGPSFLGIVHGIIFSISYILLIFLGYVTERRSDFYNKSLDAILGYEDFIRTVEQDRLKIMIEEDPSVFYHVLGFAIVFGLADKWADKFRGLYVESPAWYYSSDPVFDYIVFSHFADKWKNAYRNDMFMASSAGSNGHRGGSSFSSFGSSGFAGGGFSGGGSRGW